MLKKLEMSGIGNKAQGDIWKQQFPQFSVMIDDESVMHLYRHVNGDLQEVVANSLAHVVTGRLAEIWIAEHAQAVQPSKKRTREDAAAQLPDDPHRYTKQQTHDAIGRANLGLEDKLRNEFKAKMDQVEKRVEAQLQPVKQALLVLHNAISGVIPQGQLTASGQWQ